MVKTADQQRTTQASPEPITGAAESRHDPVTGNWTIFAPHRDERPNEFLNQAASANASRASKSDCPFCAGNEQDTPRAVWSRQIPDTGPFAVGGDPDQEDWSVRVVPNKYPAINLDEHPVAAEEHSQLFRREPVFGGHEVVIESRRHAHSMTDLDLSEVHLVFQAFRDRLLHYRQQPGVQYMTVFKNVGRDAGASLSHSHSQIVATNIIPQPIQTQIKTMVGHRATTGCCLRCDMIRAEKKGKDRLVACDKRTIAFCPFASTFPMMVRITSLEHLPCFEDLCDLGLESVSRMVSRTIGWLERICPNAGYNFCLNTRPPGMKDLGDAYHWSIDIFPRMARLAGFELGSGCMLNPCLPEIAAAKYRACAQAENPRRLLS